MILCVRTGPCLSLRGHGTYKRSLAVQDEDESSKNLNACLVFVGPVAPINGVTPESSGAPALQDGE
ncbi:MAG: hypothetical protein ACP5GH_04510 [Nitrososphaeria archaeon]